MTSPTLFIVHWKESFPIGRSFPLPHLHRTQQPAWITVINQNFYLEITYKKMLPASYTTTTRLIFLVLSEKSSMIESHLSYFSLEGQHCIITPLLYSPNRFYLILADFRIKFPWSCCKSLKKIIKNERNDSFVSFIVISLWDWDFCRCCWDWCSCWWWRLWCCCCLPDFSLWMAHLSDVKLYFSTKFNVEGHQLFWDMQIFGLSRKKVSVDGFGLEH